MRTMMPCLPFGNSRRATTSPTLNCSTAPLLLELEDGCRDRGGIVGVHRGLSGRGGGESQIHHGPDASSVNPGGQGGGATKIPLGRRSYSIHADALVRAPGPDLGRTGLVDPLHPNVNSLAARSRVRPADHFPLSGLVVQAVASLELHGQDSTCGGRRGVRLLLWPLPRAPGYHHPKEEELAFTATRAARGSNPSPPWCPNT